MKLKHYISASAGIISACVLMLETINTVVKVPYIHQISVITGAFMTFISAVLGTLTLIVKGKASEVKQTDDEKTNKFRESE
jgi:hypothetical protein